jgi:hydrogenase maturation factor HypF (carbamoyltransferase family)
MTNPLEHDVENMKVRVRCGDCRTTFHERLGRVIHGDRVVCPTCHEELRFHGIGHMHDHETIADFIHHVEERTAHPHFSLSR